MKEPFRLSVNGHYELDLLPEQAQNLDCIPDGEGRYHLLLGDRAFHVELEATDYAARQYTFRVNGATYTVHIADQYERLIQQLGLSVGSNQKQNTVKAPMPGLVLNVLVEPGQAVSKGEPLLILEAMKMENVLKATGDGTVKSVSVSKGAAVEKGQLLLEMA